MSVFCGAESEYGVSLNLSSGEFLSLEILKRLSRKKVEQWREIARNEVAAKAGRSWAFIEQFCRTHGLTVVES